MSVELRNGCVCTSIILTQFCHANPESKSSTRKKKRGGKKKKTRASERRMKRDTNASHCVQCAHTHASHALPLVLSPECWFFKTNDDERTEAVVDSSVLLRAFGSRFTRTHRHTNIYTLIRTTIIVSISSNDVVGTTVYSRRYNQEQDEEKEKLTLYCSSLFYMFTFARRVFFFQ
jgi:hypothetical protein